MSPDRPTSSSFSSKSHRRKTTEFPQSASGPSKRPKWRLKKTLSRASDFRPIEDDDVKYAWAAYKEGALATMAGPLAENGMAADKFRDTFKAVVLQRYDGAWTLFAHTRKGFLPVGMVFAFHSHFDPALSPFMIVGDIVWFPWASSRNRIEAAVNFFDRIRNTVPLVDYAHGEINKRFWEMIAQHGLVRRIGTTFNVVKGEPVAVFETRAG